MPSPKFPSKRDRSTSHSSRTESVLISALDKMQQMVAYTHVRYTLCVYVWMYCIYICIHTPRAYQVHCGVTFPIHASCQNIHKTLCMHILHHIYTLLYIIPVLLLNHKRIGYAKGMDTEASLTVDMWKSVCRGSPPHSTALPCMRTHTPFQVWSGKGVSYYEWLFFVHSQLERVSGKKRTDARCGWSRNGTQRCIQNTRRNTSTQKGKRRRKNGLSKASARRRAS